MEQLDCVNKRDCFDFMYKKFYFLVKIVLFVIFSFTTYYIIVDMVGTQLNENIYPTRGMLFGVKQYVLLSLIAFFVLFFSLYKMPKKLSVWNYKIEICIICIYFVFCIIASYYFANDGLSEIGVVNEISDKLANNGICSDDSIEFLANYSYMRPIICYASIFAKGGKVLKSLCVCAGMALGLFASLELMKIMKCTPMSLVMCSFFFYISLPIYLSCSIFYNYSVAFWMPITILLMYSKIEEKSNSVVWYILLIVVSAIGISIFPIISVPVIAIFVDTILKKKLKLIPSLILAVLISTLFSNVSNKIIDDKIYNTEELQNMCEQNEIPMFESTLYVSLNSDSLGFYTLDDLAHVRYIGSCEDRKTVLRNDIKQRIKELNYRIVDFAFKKSALAFGHGTFYSEAVSNDRLLVQRDIIRFFSAHFPQVKYYRSFYCAQNIILLLLMLILLATKKNSLKYNVIFLTTLGVWMVSMISETDSRHLLPFLPLFIVMASGMLGGIFACNKKAPFAEDMTESA